MVPGPKGGSAGSRLREHTKLPMIKVWTSSNDAVVVVLRQLARCARFAAARSFSLFFSPWVAKPREAQKKTAPLPFSSASLRLPVGAWFGWALALSVSPFSMRLCVQPLRRAHGCSSITVGFDVVARCARTAVFPWPLPPSSRKMDVQIGSSLLS